MAGGKQKYNTNRDKIITLAELKQHGKLKDAWIAVAGGVYDITEFIRTHPGMNGAGGATSTIVAIMNALGKDCTDDFTAIHSQTAWNQLEGFRIGRLESRCAGHSEAWTGYDDVEVRAAVSQNVAEDFARHMGRTPSSHSISSTASENFSIEISNEATGRAQDELPSISLGELSKHSSTDSAWVAVGGTVYDITRLLDEGTLGSMATSMLCLGGDCTQIFNYIPALQSPKLLECMIGKLVQ
jgi:cytochrome b involved in lipid metabolism